MDIQAFVKQIHTPFDEVVKAFQKVRNELSKHGLLRDGSWLDAVQCLHDSLPIECVVRKAEGLWKKEKLAIVFPRFYFAGGKKDSALDVIRHEFGHALADLYPTALSKGGLFKEAFGAKYGPNPAPDTDPDNWEFDFVSPYAARATQEDFAETFMLFLKHKGKLPAKFATKPAIKKKWAAVAEIVKHVRASEN